jgi:outer membrane autotransporter protein
MGALGYAHQDFETRRNVTIGTATTVASASHRGDEWSAYGEAEYTMSFGSYQLKPFGGLRYISLEEDGYTETGSAANLAVAGRTTESIVSLLGMRYVRPFNAGAGAFEARAIWSHEFGDADPAVSGRLAAGPATPSFTVLGVPIERDSITLGAGLSNQVSKNLSLHADFNVELRGQGQAQYGLVAGLRYAW